MEDHKRHQEEKRQAIFHNSGSDREPLLRRQTRSTPVQGLNDSQESQPETEKIQSTRQPTTVETSILPLLKSQLHTLTRDSRGMKQRMNPTCHCHPQLFQNERKKCCTSLWILKTA